MAKREPEVRALIDELKGRNDVPAGALSAIQSTIESSPYLASVMSDAVRSGALKHLDFMSDAHKAGDYDGNGTIRLEVGNFDQALRNPSQIKDNLAVVLGHETGHALMADSSRRHLYLFETSVDVAIRQSVRDAMTDGVNQTDPVDLTPHVSRYLEASRKNEGLAELIGMNALASRVSGGDPARFDRAQFLRRVDPSTPCVDIDPQTQRARLEQGIALGKDGLQLTGGKIDSHAVDRVAQCFFDDGVGLGPKGQSNYREYYGADAFERIARTMDERAQGTTRTLSPVELDLSKLKLDPDAVSRAGLDLGAQGKTFTFYDISRGQSRLESVEQLSPSRRSHGSRHPHAEAPIEQNTPSPVRLLADQPDHPAFNQFEQIRLAALASGRWNEEESRNIAGSLLKEHLRDPLNKTLDTCVVGNRTAQGEINVFAVHSPYGPNCPPFRTHVNGDVAAKEPLSENLQQIEQIREKNAQDFIQQQSQQLESPAQRGPRMSM